MSSETENALQGLSGVSVEVDSRNGVGYETRIGLPSGDAIETSLDLPVGSTTSSGFGSSAASSSEAWFVPDPEDAPPETIPVLHSMSQENIAMPPISSSTLPTTHILGVRIPSSLPSSASGSVWGSNPSTPSTPPPREMMHTSSSTAHDDLPTLTAASQSSRALSNSGSHWNTAVPHEIAVSPRGRFGSGEHNPSSPRVSAHRVSVSQTAQPQRPSPNATVFFGSSSIGSPSTGSGSVFASTPSTIAASPLSPRSESDRRMVPMIPTSKLSGRDSYDTADGSSSHVSGSVASRMTTLSSESEGEYDTSSSHGISGSVPNPSMMSPRSGQNDTTPHSPSSLKLSGSSGIVSPRVANTGTLRTPRTKSVALNPMVAKIQHSSVSSASGASSTPAASSSPNTSTAPTSASPSLANRIPPNLSDRRASSTQTLQGLQAIPAPIAAALNLIQETPEMRTGGDIHLHQWAWDPRHKHPFLKVSSDHSSLSWSSATNYGLARGNLPLSHTKTFIEVAKTRGVSQLLQIGLAKPSVNWSASPEKMQFNSLKIAGEWTAVWVKTSTTGDRFGVLFDFDTHKMTVYRNGLVAYTHDIPKSFQVVEEKEDAAAQVYSPRESSVPSSSSSLSHSPSSSLLASASSSNVSSADPVYPFIGACGDQDILITESPEFEKYTDIAWAHDRISQLLSHQEALEGVPAVLDLLGLQKLRPKFEGMDLLTFQKLKDADLRKLGASTEQRRRLISQIETMKS